MIDKSNRQLGRQKGRQGHATTSNTRHAIAPCSERVKSFMANHQISFWKEWTAASSVHGQGHKVLQSVHQLSLSVMSSTYLVVLCCWRARHVGIGAPSLQSGQLAVEQLSRSQQLEAIWFHLTEAYPCTNGTGQMEQSISNNNVTMG